MTTFSIVSSLIFLSSLGALNQKAAGFISTSKKKTANIENRELGKQPEPAMTSSGGESSKSASPRSSSSSNNNKGKTDQDKVVNAATDKDILLGRGNQVNNREGNIQFRRLAQQRALEYSSCTSKLEKDTIARQIALEVDEQGGRFLRSIETTNPESGEWEQKWEIVEEETVLTKVKQTLRDCAATMRKGVAASLPSSSLSSSSGVAAAAAFAPSPHQHLHSPSTQHLFQQQQQLQQQQQQMHQHARPPPFGYCSTMDSSGSNRGQQQQQHLLHQQQQHQQHPSNSSSASLALQLVAAAQQQRQQQGGPLGSVSQSVASVSAGRFPFLGGSTSSLSPPSLSQQLPAALQNAQQFSHLSSGLQAQLNQQQDQQHNLLELLGQQRMLLDAHMPQGGSGGGSGVNNLSPGGHFGPGGSASSSSLQDAASLLQREQRLRLATSQLAAAANQNQQNQQQQQNHQSAELQQALVGLQMARDTLLVQQQHRDQQIVQAQHALLRQQLGQQSQQQQQGTGAGSGIQGSDTTNRMLGADPASLLGSSAASAAPIPPTIASLLREQAQGGGGSIGNAINSGGGSFLNTIAGNSQSHHLNHPPSNSLSPQLEALLASRNRQSQFDHQQQQQLQAQHYPDAGAALSAMDRQRILALAANNNTSIATTSSIAPLPDARGSNINNASSNTGNPDGDGNVRASDDSSTEQRQQQQRTKRKTPDEKDDDDDDEEKVQPPSKK